MNCNEFATYENPGDWSPCRCPKCKGFLPKEFPFGKQFLCPKCGAVLETMPSPVDDPDIPEDTDYEFGGRICLVPDYAVKIDRTLPPKPQREIKKKTSLWAVGRAFFRRVWADEKGERFIEFAGEGRVPVTNPRVLKIVEDPQEALK